MKKYLYSICDLVSKEFAGPWLDNNDAAAARRFSSWLAQNSGQKGFKSTDFSLYCVGAFDVLTGEIFPCFYDVSINEGDVE